MIQAPQGQLREGVSAAIRALRAERGWTQRELCRRSDLSPAYLSELEAAQKDASADVLERLAAAFGIGIDQFLWIMLLGMIHGEVPGVQRRESALSVARQLLDLRPGDRQEIEQFLAFLRWRAEGPEVRVRNKRGRQIVDDTENSGPEITED
jgi:transcriptional regulator with XRE-family HTH domain